jgi:hypothetical protein
MMNGVDARATRMTGTPLIAEARKRLRPTGGVRQPIIRLSVTTTPK